MIAKLTGWNTLTLLFAAWLCICFLGGIEVLIIHLFRPDTIQSTKFYWLAPMRILNGFAAISLVLYPGYRYLRDKSWAFRILGFFALMILFILVYLAFSVGQFQLAFLNLTPGSLLAGIGETLMTDLHHIASYYFFLILICAGKDYFDDRTKAIIKKEQAEGELARTKLQVLQRQIQPHFLFNTLNGAVAIMEERTDKAQEMLLDLSELLRTAMEMDFEERISLRQELELLRRYLGIEEKRFEHQLAYEMAVDEAVFNCPVLPFLLQPLVENAIKHGFKEGTSVLKIKIAGWIAHDQLVLQVTNDGARLMEAGRGIGLANVRERLFNAYSDHASFSLDQQGDLVVNTIKIPMK